MTIEKTSRRGIIAWFAANHVAANLLMLVIVAAGIYSASTIRKQTLPEFDLNTIQVRVPYLGAAPQEVEEGVVIKVEEAIQDLDGIESLRSVSAEGIGTVTVEVRENADIDGLLNEIKTRVDAIATFPAQAEKPVIYKQEVPNEVMLIALYGDIDQFSRTMLAQQIGKELVTLPEVSEVDYYGDRDFEISIEVSEQNLRKYGLTLTEIAQAVRNSSVDLPGGTINSAGGDILLRTKGQAYTGTEFGNLVLRTYADGTRLTLSDIATINDGFVEDKPLARFNGRSSISIRVLTSDRIDELQTSAAVREFVRRKQAELPDNVDLEIWANRSPYLQDRLDMMLENMAAGALLVFLMLALFLRARVAAWVIVGIPLSFLGALWLMPFMPSPVTINMLSLFGFIMVLGIVVDDAIIIGESIYTTTRADGHSLDSVVRGAHRVAVPATFGVLTTIAAFLPLMFIGGAGGPFFEAMGAVVILCLFFSLIESKLILPAHLAATRISPIDEDDLFHPTRAIALRERIPRFFTRINRRVQNGLHRFIDSVYRPWLGVAVDNRGITVATFVAVLIVCLGLVAGGKVRLVIFPEVAGEFIRVQLNVRDGTPREERDAAILKVEDAIHRLNEEYNAANPGEPPYVRIIASFGTGKSSGLLFAELPRDVERDFDAWDVIADWRREIGEIPGLKDVNFTFGFPLGGGSPISVQLNGDNIQSLERAANEIADKLVEYEGVFDVVNSSATGAQEIELSIKPQAEALGLTLANLGRQVRQAFYGEEAQRIQRGKNEIRVMVRYPYEERRSVANLENMKIRTADGTEVPFNSVADLSFGSGYSAITRLNRTRTVTVSADNDSAVTTPQSVISDIETNFVPGVLQRNPGVRFGLEGAAQEEGEFIRNTQIAFLFALFLIYLLIAIPLKSYAQPFIIMSVIPFGIIGAVIGHLVLGEALSMFSIFGLVALAGVVVNDSLIMVDFINKARQVGVPLREAVIESGAQRFRAIILTSVTTAVGLFPILVETSAQAQFLIPMAISVSFGILFATVITLFLIPCLYMLQVGFFDTMRNLWNFLLGRSEQRSASEPA
ncbi:MAG: efflux RND transporter permease subunit [Woeseiaceae bacterium]|nr:efflux RND transporter permease subunit [Woeseiaceae bacterium]